MTAVKKWKPEGTEHENQVALVKWAALNLKTYPELSALYAIPNAARRSPFQGAWMKAEGLRAGFPDIGLPVPRDPYHGLYIEMKVGKNKPTPAQCAWHERLRAFGNRVEVCYGWQEAVKVIEEYLGAK